MEKALPSDLCLCRSQGVLTLLDAALHLSAPLLHASLAGTLGTNHAGQLMRCRCSDVESEHDMHLTLAKLHAVAVAAGR